MLISGVQKFTVLDFPGRLACIVFLAGCNFRCGYCHNPEFVLPENIKKLQGNFITEEAILEFLRQRRGLLEGVVISGGEPTMSAYLPEFIGKLKELDFLVKLDTNGNNPKMLARLFDTRHLDYVAMDIKMNGEGYADLVGSCVVPEFLRESMEMIRGSGIDYEFRSTLIREVHSEDVLRMMAAELKGAKRLYLQEFRPQHTLKPEFGSYHPYSREEMTDFAHRIFSPYIQKVEVR